MRAHVHAHPHTRAGMDVHSRAPSKNGSTPDGVFALSWRRRTRATRVRARARSLRGRAAPHRQRLRHERLGLGRVLVGKAWLRAAVEGHRGCVDKGCQGALRRPTRKVARKHAPNMAPKSSDSDDNWCHRSAPVSMRRLIPMTSGHVHMSTYLHIYMRTILQVIKTTYACIDAFTWRCAYARM